MMISFIFILQIILFGTLVTHFFKLKLYFEERIAAGFLIGFIWFGYVMLGFSYFWGLEYKSILGYLLVNALMVLILYSSAFLSQIKLEIIDLFERFRHRSWLIFWGILLIVCVLLSFEVSQLLTFERNQFYVQPLHAYGDIAWHLSLITSFAYGSIFRPRVQICLECQFRILLWWILLLLHLLIHWDLVSKMQSRLQVYL